MAANPAIQVRTFFARRRAFRARRHAQFARRNGRLRESVDQAALLHERTTFAPFDHETQSRT
jgi:hypothetical protein